MPCLTGLEGTPDTRTTKERKAMEAEREREDKKWRKEEQRRLQMIKDELDKEMSEGRLENLFFNSPMTVFLCKTMDIIVSNFGHKFTTHDLEWWHKEHTYRDHNNGESLIDKKELAEKLIQLNKIYTVTK
jgi:hypothetical protein